MFLGPKVTPISGPSVKVLQKMNVMDTWTATLQHLYFSPTLHVKVNINIFLNIKCKVSLHSLHDQVVFFFAFCEVICWACFTWLGQTWWQKAKPILVGHNRKWTSPWAVTSWGNGAFCCRIVYSEMHAFLPWQLHFDVCCPF